MSMAELEYDLDLVPLSCCTKHGLYVPLITWYGSLMWIDCPRCKDERWAEEKRIRGEWLERLHERDDDYDYDYAAYMRDATGIHG